GKRNYQRIYIPQQPTTFSANINCSTSGIPAITNATYYDGLGRTMQEVFRHFNTGVGDLVNVHTYDEEGRESYKYLPFEEFENFDVQGKLEPTPYTKLMSFYNVDYQGDQPFTQTLFDWSPLNRVTDVLAPGNAWVGSGRGVTT